MIRAIEIQDGIIWAGGISGLVSYDGVIWTSYDFNDVSLIIDIMAVGSQELWFGGSHGLAKYDGSDWIKYDSTNSPIKSRARKLTIDLNNNIWIGTSKDGIIKIGR